MLLLQKIIIESMDRHTVEDFDRGLDSVCFMLNKQFIPLNGSVSPSITMGGIITRYIYRLKDCSVKMLLITTKS